MKKQTKISIAKARAHLTELIDRAALADEEFIITKCGKPRAKIVPLFYNDIPPRPILKRIKFTEAQFKKNMALADEIESKRPSTLASSVSVFNDPTVETNQKISRAIKNKGYVKANGQFIKLHSKDKK